LQALRSRKPTTDFISLGPKTFSQRKHSQEVVFSENNYNE
jgi:hypothetical protein